MWSWQPLSRYVGRGKCEHKADISPQMEVAVTWTVTAASDPKTAVLVIARTIAMRRPTVVKTVKAAPCHVPSMSAVQLLDTVVSDPSSAIRLYRNSPVRRASDRVAPSVPRHAVAAVRDSDPSATGSPTTCEPVNAIESGPRISTRMVLRISTSPLRPLIQYRSR